ncbi:Uncharacterised protein [Klebsiella variicola]|nr:Uncharacterised protein [Klebsiella variicola]
MQPLTAGLLCWKGCISMCQTRHENMLHARHVAAWIASGLMITGAAALSAASAERVMVWI